MKTLLSSLAAAGLIAALLPSPGAAAPGGGHGFSRGGGPGFSRGAGPAFRGGPAHGPWRGGYGYRGWGHRGWGPGYFWGGVGLGLGIGSIAYYNAWPGPYYRGYGGYGWVQPGYVVVDPAPGDVVVRSAQPVPLTSAAPSAPDPIFYPRNGQSTAQTEGDRRECNRWATTQQGALADAAIFQRATIACMEGRGYTVK